MKQMTVVEPACRGTAGECQVDKSLEGRRVRYSQAAGIRPIGVSDNLVSKWIGCAGSRRRREPQSNSPLAEPRGTDVYLDGAGWYWWKSQPKKSKDGRSRSSVAYPGAGQDEVSQVVRTCRDANGSCGLADRFLGLRTQMSRQVRSPDDPHSFQDVGREGLALDTGFKCRNLAAV